MNCDVTEEVLTKTKQCPNGFSCLKTGKGKCDVYDMDGEDMFFVSCHDICRCPYRLYFGDRQLCACSTHYALYKNGLKVNTCCCEKEF